MLKFLTTRFQKVFDKLKKQTRLTEDVLQEFLREIKFVLLEADVHLVTIKWLLTRLKERATAEELIGKLNVENRLVDIFNEELREVLGGRQRELKFVQYPKSIMLVGLQGSGKTTTAGKLALWLRKHGVCKRPLLVGLDTHRPAAIQQLETLARQINVSVYSRLGVENPAEIARECQHVILEGDHDLVIYDTAGRLAIDEKLMTELEELHGILAPEKVIQVVDGMSGQNILATITAFNQIIKLSGFIFTKLDSDARGGALLSVTHALQLPIFFIGEGEKLSSLQYFYPDRFVSRIFNQGDIATLIEQGRERLDEQSVQDIGKRLMAGTFDLEDLMESLRQINKLGKIANVMKMLPGVGRRISTEQLSASQRRLEVFSVLLSSMTPAERRNPKLLRNNSRKMRIITGSGRSAQDFNSLMNSFDMLSKQMRSGSLREISKLKF